MVIAGTQHHLVSLHFSAGHINAPFPPLDNLATLQVGSIEPSVLGFLVLLPALHRTCSFHPQLIMHKLGRAQRDKVQQFITISGASEKSALQALKASEWNLEGAFEYFYSQPPSRPAIDFRHLDELYLRYKDSFSDMILADGISVFCDDLQVEPGDIVMLVLSWHMKAATMCEFSRQEFVGGLQSLGVDSIEKLKYILPALRSEAKDEHKFREIYNFAFNWAKEKGQKSLALETAVGMWQLLFAERQWSLVDQWCHFLQAKHNKAISKDTWSQLLEFSRAINPTLSNYDSEGAWPYLIDEFVEYLLEIGVANNKGA